MLINLQGQIERITYFNEENGYTIARLKVYGQKDLVTVVGNLMSPTPGEILKLKGVWTNHPKYGEQFKVLNYESIMPSSVYGIERYLGSGLIKGIGPVMAKGIISEFGKESLDIIETDPEKLGKVKGIGKKRIKKIMQAWEDQKDIRNVMIFLQSHNVSSGYAVKIFKQYGNSSIKVVKENPYQLAIDIFGIGFVIADSIAEKLGFPKDSKLRINAGILYVLHQLSNDGHVYYPYEPLIEKCKEILGSINRDIIIYAFGSNLLEKKIVIEDLNEDQGEFKENNKAVYLAKYHLCETSIARRLVKLLNFHSTIKKIDTEKIIKWVQEKLSITLAERQILAVKCALENKIMVITGGPGTGKSTIINAIVKIFTSFGMKILLAAPTGRAAKRMSEITGLKSRTIHRLLEYSIKRGGFQINESNPLNCDLLIVDESSMIDTILMHYLLKAIPPRATFILVGDVNQLPSVGAGDVLRNIIISGIVTVIELIEIFRQAKKSQIIVNAHRINQGILPLFNQSLPQNDFFFIEKEDPEDVLKIILELTSMRIPQKFGFDPFKDIQILTPMYRGVVGADNLNIKLQNILNPCKDNLIYGNRDYRVNDKVMQIKNNYDKEIFNGDIGTIRSINKDDQELILSFDGRDVVYDFGEMDEIVLAYAVSIHKSQGSEYPVVIIPITIQHYLLLQRNLIYTAITRGRKLVVIVGTTKAMAISIKNDKIKMRHTYLRQRLINSTLNIRKL